MAIHPVDIVILAVYLAAVVALGSWVGRGSRTLGDYVVGRHDLPWWVILFSIVATETSTVTFLSIPGFAYSQDMTWLQIPLGFVIGRVAVVFLLLPQYFRGSMFTSYEVLGRRFGGATKQAASALFIVTRSLADGLRLFLTAIVLQEMTGIPLHWSVVAIGVTTIVYTFFGGIRAVLWTDVVQFFVYVSGGVLAFMLLLQRLPGGWQQMVEVGGAAGKFRVFDTVFDWSQPYGLWAGLVGGCFVTLGSHGVDQLMVQRYLSARNQKDAGRALWLGGLVVFAQFALFLLVGVGLYAFYQQFPPDVAFDRADRVFAYFIVHEMPVGLLGILLGAIFAAAMSTLSSSLNSCATAAINDIYRPSAPRTAAQASGADDDGSGSPEQSAKLLGMTRALTVVFGFVQIGVGIAGQWLQASVVSSVLGIAAFTTGIVLGVFFLGVGCPRVGQRAALTGLLVGLAAMSWIFFATSLAWPWFALFGSAITFGVGWGASWIWPRRDHHGQ